MTYKIRILDNAQEDLDWLRNNDKTSYIKCFDLVALGLLQIVDGDFEGDTEGVKDGVFQESTLRSAPGFTARIDGITELNAN